MATCKECFHCSTCDMIYESCTGKNVSDLEFPNDAELCEHFKDKANTVEVVRCKDCKYWLHMDDGMGDCTNARFHLDGHADPTMKMDDFCSCGERREGE